MSGEYLYLLVTKRPLSAGSLMNVVVALGLAGLAVASLRAALRAGGPARMTFRDRVLLFHLAIFVLIAVQLVITKKAWGPHHIMMLYPFQLLITFGQPSVLPERGGWRRRRASGGFGPPCRCRLRAGISTYGRVRAAVEPGRL